MDRLAIDTDDRDRLVVSSRPSLEQSRRGSSLFTAALIAVTLGGLGALAYFVVLALGASRSGSIGALSIYGPILFTVGGLAVAALRAAPRFRRLTIGTETWRLETLAVRRLSRDPTVIERTDFEGSAVAVRVEEDDRGRPYLTIIEQDEQRGMFGDIATSRLSDDAALKAFRHELQTLQERIETR